MEDTSGGMAQPTGPIVSEKMRSHTTQKIDWTHLTAGLWVLIAKQPIMNRTTLMLDMPMRYKERRPKYLIRNQEAMVPQKAIPVPPRFRL